MDEFMSLVPCPGQGGEATGKYPGGGVLAMENESGDGDHTAAESLTNLVVLTAPEDTGGSTTTFARQGNR